MFAVCGCASYDPQPLPQQPNLQGSLARLDTVIPLETGQGASRRIDTARPLSIDDVGLLAVLNDPDLKPEQGVSDAARADVVQATLLPNPTTGFAYGQLLGGPGTASSAAVALAEEIIPIVTRDARVKAAEARFHQVDADQLWREWQVAQKARQLALDISYDDRSIALTEKELAHIGSAKAKVGKAVAVGNLALGAYAPLLSASSAQEQSLAALRLQLLKNWQALDALLGLDPSVRFVIAPPAVHAPPQAIEPLVASLPERRPDLAALRFGYDSAQEDVRAAILSQFPAFSINGSYLSDTTSIVSAGPGVTFALPVFDRNQAGVAKTRATREMLQAQYQAQLDSATATARGLCSQIARLSTDLAVARSAARISESLVASARNAYAQGNLDQRNLVDYENTAFQQELQALALERQIGEDAIILELELGLGLPSERLAVRPAQLERGDRLL
jgi:outer membrane protein TolC